MRVCVCTCMRVPVCTCFVQVDCSYSLSLTSCNYYVTPLPPSHHALVTTLSSVTEWIVRINIEYYHYQTSITYCFKLGKAFSMVRHSFLKQVSRGDSLTAVAPSPLDSTASSGVINKVPANFPFFPTWYRIISLSTQKIENR